MKYVANFVFISGLYVFAIDKKKIISGIRFGEATVVLPTVAQKESYYKTIQTLLTFNSLQNIPTFAYVGNRINNRIGAQSRGRYRYANGR